MNTQTEQISPFKAQGRIGRMTFLAWHGLVGITIMIFMLLIVIFAPNTFDFIFAYRESWGLIILSYALNIPFLYLFIIFSIKRLHDVNQSGWLSLLALVPLVNIIFSLYLIFMPGTETENKFGQARITLGWETLVGFIVAIFMVFAAMALISTFSQLAALI